MCFFGLNATLWGQAIPLNFRDTLMPSDYGSWGELPEKMTVDSIVYKINTSNLFSLPESAGYLNNCPEKNLLIFTVVLDGKGRPQSVVQRLGKKTVASAYTRGMKVHIPFYCGSDSLLSDAYRLDCIEQGSFLYLRNKKMLLADFFVNNKTYNLSYSPYAGNLWQEFQISDKDSLLQKVRMGDVFEVGGQHFRISAFDFFRKSGKLEVILNDSLWHFGLEVGKQLPNFGQIKQVIRENEHFKQKMVDGKAFLLYFWGEWCAPCLAKMDSNARLFAKIDSSKIHIVQVAGIQPNNDQRKTESLIKSHKLGYYHLLDSGNFLIHPLRIDTYPTYLLLNSDGVVLYRGSATKPPDIQKLLLLLKQNAYFL